MSSNQQLKQQVDEGRWEKQQVEQRMSVIRQTESELRTSIDNLLGDFCNDARKTVPSLNLGGESPSTAGGARPLNSSPDALRRVKAIQLTVLGELAKVTKRKDELDKKVVQLESQINAKQRSASELKMALKESQMKLDQDRNKFKKEKESLVNSYETKFRGLQDEMAALRNSQ